MPANPTCAIGLSDGRDLLRDLSASCAPEPSAAWIETLPFLAAALVVDGRPSLAIVLGAAVLPRAVQPPALRPRPRRRRRPPRRQRVPGRIRLAIAATNLPLLIVIVVLSGAAAGLALALAVAAAIAWSVPPLRTKERPVLDVADRRDVRRPPGRRRVPRRRADRRRAAVARAPGLAAWGVASSALRAIRDQTRRPRRPASPSIATLPRRPLDGGRRRSPGTPSPRPSRRRTARSGRSPRSGSTCTSCSRPWSCSRPMATRRPRPRPVGGPGRGSSAWTALVGLWLALLLLRYLDVLGFTSWQIAIVTTAAAAGYTLFNVLAIRLVDPPPTRRRGRSRTRTSRR